MSKLRLGRHHNDLVYVQTGDDPHDDDRRFAVFFRDEDALMVVRWATFLRGLEKAASDEYQTAFREAVDFWTAKLAQLDTAIANGQRSRRLGVEHIAKHLRTERRHLAALLFKLGVDVPDEPAEVTE